jgi:hypothetical protein
MRRALLVLLALSCSSKSDPPANTADTGTTTDSVVSDTPGGRKLDGDPAADNAVDPTPMDIPVVVARTKATPGPATDVKPDFSCQGQTQMASDGKPVERDFHTVELSGTDADRVPSMKFEISFVNKYPAPVDLSLTSSAGTDAMDPTRGSVKAKTPGGNLTWHVLPATGYYEIVVLDYSVDADQLIVPVTAAPEAKVAVIEALVGGSGYSHTPGNSRFVVTVRDCQDFDVMGVQLSLEVDGKTAEVKEGGVRRSYFGDNRLPSTAKWTSRSGIVAFVGVPSTDNLRLVARGRLTEGGPIEVLAMRKMPKLPDGVVTAIVAPHVEP